MVPTPDSQKWAEFTIADALIRGKKPRLSLAGITGLRPSPGGARGLERGLATVLWRLEFQVILSKLELYNYHQTPFFGQQSTSMVVLLMLFTTAVL